MNHRLDAEEAAEGNPLSGPEKLQERIEDALSAAYDAGYEAGCCEQYEAGFNDGKLSVEKKQ